MKTKIQILNTLPESIQNLSNSPKELYFIGDLNLLKRPIVSIVGSRKPRNYTKQLTASLALKLNQVGVVVASGGAIGVDTIAHKNSYPNTIAVFANSLDICYPAINRKLFDNIYKNSLALSEHKEDFRARPYSFVLRNRLVTALGECLVITEADLKSGSLTSAEYAIEQGKKVYVLTHRAGESLGTQQLIQEGKAEVIYDIDSFVQHFGIYKQDDEILTFCSLNPSIDSAINLYGDKIYEYELEGKIVIKDLKVYVA